MYLDRGAMLPLMAALQTRMVWPEKPEGLQISWGVVKDVLLELGQQTVDM